MKTGGDPDVAAGQRREILEEAGVAPCVDIEDVVGAQHELDAARRAEIMTLIERLRDVLALPILMVTHDAAEAERLATAIVRVGD